MTKAKKNKGTEQMWMKRETTYTRANVGLNVTIRAHLSSNPNVVPR